MCVIGDHPHVLSLIGIITNYPESTSSSVSGPLIIMPRMPNGDLHTYITSPENTPRMQDLLNWAYQIADGNLHDL